MSRILFSRFLSEFKVNSKFLIRNTHYYLLKFCVVTLVNKKFLWLVLIELFKPQHLKIIHVKFDEEIFNDYFLLKFSWQKSFRVIFTGRFFKTTFLVLKFKTLLTKINSLLQEYLFSPSILTFTFVNETSLHTKWLMVYQLSNSDHIKLFNNWIIPRTT